MYTCIEMTESLNLSQPKHTILFRCVGPFFFTYLFETNHFLQGVQANYDGYGAHFPSADPPEVIPGVGPHPAPPMDVPPAANGLRNLAGHFLNNPGTLINMLRIEPGPNGRFEVWIALELADTYIF